MFQFITLIFSFFVLGSLSSSDLSVPSQKDDIIGFWVTATGKSTVEIYKNEDLYFGRIIKLRTPLDEQGKVKVDKHNPEESKRKQQILGLVVLRNMKYEGGNKYSGGKIYNPEDGKEYSCNMELVNPKQLNLRGYIGISLFGKSQTWTR
jgi:uncharacterized protein (DUF2147 family)